MTIVFDRPDNPTRHDKSAFVGLSDNRQISSRAPDRHDTPLKGCRVVGSDARGNECSKHKLNQSDDDHKKTSANEPSSLVSANERVLIALSRLRGTLTPICDALQNFSKMESSNGL